MRRPGAGLALALTAALSGCAWARAPVNGFIYSDVQGPVAIAGPVLPTSDARAERVGTARCTSVLGLVAWGDAGIEAAMRHGGIRRIHHVDHESFSVVGVYAEFKTVVYGDAGEPPSAKPSPPVR